MQSGPKAKAPLHYWKGTNIVEIVNKSMNTGQLMNLFNLIDIFCMSSIVVPK